jgi:hypothetical protein
MAALIFHSENTIREVRRQHLVTKHEIQCIFQNSRWHIHLVVDEHHLGKMTEDLIIGRLKELNFRLCKRFLHRRFAKFKLEEKFHWTAVFQGNKDACKRHAHVLIHVPSCAPMRSAWECLRLRSSIQMEWLRIRGRDEPLFLWFRPIRDSGDSRAVATYITRELTRKGWEHEDVHFSQ